MIHADLQTKIRERLSDLSAQRENLIAQMPDAGRGALPVMALQREHLTGQIEALQWVLTEGSRRSGGAE